MAFIIVEQKQLAKSQNSKVLKVFRMVVLQESRDQHRKILFYKYDSVMQGTAVDTSAIYAIMLTGYVIQIVDEDLFSADFGVEVQEGKTNPVFYLICIVAFSVQSTYQADIVRFKSFF